MKCLEYPFDSTYLIGKKKRIRRELLEGKAFVDKKIAILGGSTTSNIKLVMELFLLNQGIRPVFYESEYNHYFEDAVFSNPELDEFHPDIVYICTTYRNLVQVPSITDTVEEIEMLLKNEAAKYYQVWKSVKERFNCPIIQNNFEYPYYRLLGNKDRSDVHGVVNYISRLNMVFDEYAQKNEDFFICDINYISSSLGLSNWHDQSFWYMYKYGMSMNAIPYLAYNVSNIIKSIFGKNKKGFILDLDNTLWGGIVGDDGVDNLILGPEVPAGQAYIDFQKYIKEHQKRGLILSIASKNEEENALAGLKHPNSVLEVEDFAKIKANWNPKSNSCIEIASELNVLPESLVFIDDNPAEREIVTNQISGITAPEIETVEEYINLIDKLGCFELTYFSDDDLKRNQMYKENAKREAQLANYADYDEYLKSLEMRATIKSFEPVYFGRISQLTNKSNQFNLTTQRYSQIEIENFAADNKYITLYASLQDKFGDNGVVSVVIGEVIGEVCHVRLWLMSCRVLKRNLEHAIFDKLVHKCNERSINKIVGYYYPTSKNKMVKEFWQEFGFINVTQDEIGNTEWEYQVMEEYENKNKVIVVEE